jgi:hypothetical protein
MGVGFGRGAVHIKGYIFFFLAFFLNPIYSTSLQ